MYWTVFLGGGFFGEGGGGGIVCFVTKVGLKVLLC